MTITYHVFEVKEGRKDRKIAIFFDKAEAIDHAEWFIEGDFTKFRIDEVVWPINSGLEEPPP